MFVSIVAVVIGAVLRWAVHIQRWHRFCSRAGVIMVLVGAACLMVSVVAAVLQVRRAAWRPYVYGLDPAVVVLIVGAVLLGTGPHHWRAFDTDTLGWILVAAGSIGVVVSVLVASQWGRGVFGRSAVPPSTDMGYGYDYTPGDDGWRPRRRFWR